MTDQTTKVTEAMKVLMNQCNLMGSTTDIEQAMVNVIVGDHRTIQQSFWRVMTKVISSYAEASSDDRNKASVEMCVKFTEVTEQMNLPYI